MDVNTEEVSWEALFHRYHMQILAGDPRARTLRDKALLDMIQSGATTSSPEIWEYLTQMLSNQKL